MSFVEIAKKTGRGLALTAALFAAGSLAAAPGTAYARDWHGGGNHWGGGHWGGHHHGGGAGIGLGGWRACRSGDRLGGQPVLLPVQLQLRVPVLRV